MASSSSISASKNIKKERSGSRCVVVDCKNTVGRNKNVSWHSFPLDETLKKEWIRRIGRGNQNTSFGLFNPSKSSRICGQHFNESGRKKISDRLPKYNLPKVYNNNDDLCFLQKYDFDKLSNNETTLSQDTSSNEVVEEEIMIDVVGDTTNEALFQESNRNHISKLTIEKQLSVIITSKTIRKKTNTSRKILALNLKLKNVLLLNKKYEKNIKCQKNVNVNLQKNILQLQDKIILLKKDIDNLNFNYDSTLFKIENVKKNPKKLHFYTGFNGIERYLAFESLVEECYNNSKEKEESVGRPKKLNFSNEIFLYFCRIRCGLLEQDLAYRFNVSTSTVSRIFSYWSAFLCDLLSKVPIWIDRQTLDETMPTAVKAKYPKTRVIIDATEIFVELPSDFNTQSDIYSQYKHHSTAKGMTGCDTLGRVTFVSDLVPGKMSDKELTINSGLLELLEEGDSVMCDRGFLLEEEFHQIGVELNMPAFLNGRSQLPLEEENESRQIANFRINIERVFREVKTFRILKQVFPNSMHDKLNEIFKVCCFLVNFMNEPLLTR